MCCEVCINMSVKERAAWLQTLNKLNLEEFLFCAQDVFFSLFVFDQLK